MERKQHWCNNLVFHSEMQLCHDLINKQLQTVRLKMWMAMSGNIMCLTNYCTHYSPTDHFVFVPLTKAPSCEKWIGLAISLIESGVQNFIANSAWFFRHSFLPFPFPRKYVVSASIDIHLQCRNLQERNISDCAKIKSFRMPN